ncbi:MAG: LPXTG cell wall anchor domain-containing protein [Micromonospora sp.]
MRQRRRLGLALSSAAAAGVACFAIATPALADPPGNNGTVKIDTVEVDDHNDPNIANRPHVGCDFQVRFFGFDKDQTAKITFTIHPPSGSGEELSSETKTISTDDAAGGLNDEDEVFTYHVADWDLSTYKEQPKQGYHVKLTIYSEGVPGGVKHKVFWVPNCTSTESPSPTPTPTPSESESPTTPSSPGASLSGGAGGGNGENGGSLPLTGVAATSTALTGLALIGGGAALMVLRRRRDKITFTS